MRFSSKPAMLPFAVDFGEERTMQSHQIWRECALLLESEQSEDLDRVPEEAAMVMRLQIRLEMLQRKMNWSWSSNSSLRGAMRVVQQSCHCLAMIRQVFVRLLQMRLGLVFNQTKL